MVMIKKLIGIGGAAACAVLLLTTTTCFAAATAVPCDGTWGDAYGATLIENMINMCDGHCMRMVQCPTSANPGADQYPLYICGINFKNVGSQVQGTYYLAKFNGTQYEAVNNKGITLPPGPPPDWKSMGEKCWAAVSTSQVKGTTLSHNIPQHTIIVPPKTRPLKTTN